MGCHFLSPGDLPDSGIEPGSPTLQGKADTLPSEPPGKPWIMIRGQMKLVVIVMQYGCNNYLKFSLNLSFHICNMGILKIVSTAMAYEN